MRSGDGCRGRRRRGDGRSSSAMIDASCSNVAPSVVPVPAVCSSRIIVLLRRRRAAELEQPVRRSRRQPLRFIARSCRAPGCRTTPSRPSASARSSSSPIASIDCWRSTGFVAGEVDQIAGVRHHRTGCRPPSTFGAGTRRTLLARKLAARATGWRSSRRSASASQPVNDRALHRRAASHARHRHVRARAERTLTEANG